MDKVAVFLDYENVHRKGHNLFAGVGEPLYETVVNPLQVAERLVAKRRDGGVLTSVKVFRGRPVPSHQPRLASANDVQSAAWEADDRVKVIRRDLKIAAWTGSKPLWFPELMRQTPPIRLPFCHFLDAEDFLRLRDYSDAE